MGILPDYQHQGIGSHLLKYTEKHLQKQKKLSIELITLDEHPDYP
jgi:ribosomal protein S18 acetylase RimI-like enzyme